MTIARAAVRLATGPEKRTRPLTGRNGLVHRYFYFSMSLLLAAIVVEGFKRTVDHNLFHPAVSRPFILSLRWFVYTKSVGIVSSAGLAQGSPP
ncbi:MAG: hypothetical protein ABSB67_12970 [Bryobacteraceae bacterium]